MFIQSNKEVAGPMAEQPVFEMALSALQNKQYAEAYILFLQVQKESPDDAATLFNLGVCCHAASSYAEALSYLDAGLEKLQAVGVKQEPTANPQMVQKVELLDAQENFYNMPMNRFEISTFPKRSRERFLRLIIDICFFLQDYDRVRKTAAILQGKHYKNVEDILQKLT